MKTQITNSVTQSTLFFSLSLGVLEYAYAHSASRGFVLLLPTGLVIFGGTLAVVVTMLLIGLTRHRLAQFWGTWQLSFNLPPLGLSTIGSLLSFVWLMWLVFVGYNGSTDPLSNPLPLTIWTLGWVVLVLMHAILGHIWRYINPWTGVIWLLEKTLRKSISRGLLTLPAWLGYTPAVLGFFGFAWFELISLAPEDPESLATMVFTYWLMHLLLIILFGTQDWLARGEPFSVLFRFLAYLSPFSTQRSDQRTQIQLSLPGSPLLNHRAIGWTGTLFILLTLATISFDGLNKTYWWLHLNGINPLAFAGRSSVLMVNSIGMIMTYAVLSLLFFLAVYAGYHMTSRKVRLTVLSGRLILALLPISLAYHYAHFATQALVNGQYTLKAYSDPLASGANYLGFSQLVVTTSFLNHHLGVKVIWAIQVTAIVVGHAVSAILAHLIALRLYPHHTDAIRAQLALAVLMVAYTVFGLWLLSTATGI